MLSGLFLAVTIGLGTFALLRMATVNAAAIDVRDNWLPSVVTVNTLNAATRDYRLTVARHVIATNPTEKTAIEHELDAIVSDIKKDRVAYEPLITPGEERGLIDAFDRQWGEYLTVSKAVLDASRKQDRATVEALFNGKARDEYASVTESLNDDIALNIRESKKVGDAGASVYASASLWIMAALAMSMLLCAITGWSIVKSVSQPIAAMTEAMRRLSNRDMAVAITGLGRKDEIGAMASAVQVFKDNMIAADRVVAEQTSENETKARRSQQVESLTARVETKVSELVNAVASAATEMEATAGSMSATAEQTNQQSVTVASAAEETSVNVQTVATATEELAAGVSEFLCVRRCPVSPNIGRTTVSDG